MFVGYRPDKYIVQYRNTNMFNMSLRITERRCINAAKCPDLHTISTGVAGIFARLTGGAVKWQRLLKLNCFREDQEGSGKYNRVGGKKADKSSKKVKNKLLGRGSYFDC